MVEKDVLLEKVNHIQNCLSRIHSKTNDSNFDINDLDTQDVIVLNVQRAIQLSIDIANHVVATEKLGMPQNFKESFQILNKNKIIDNELTDKLGRMVGFRNIAVHEYQVIDTEILKSIVQHHLQNIEAFYTKVLLHFKIANI